MGCQRAEPVGRCFEKYFSTMRMRLSNIAMLALLAGCDDNCCGNINAQITSTLYMPAEQTMAQAIVSRDTNGKQFLDVDLTRYAPDCGNGQECAFMYFLDGGDDFRINGTSIVGADYRANPLSNIRLDVSAYALPFDVEMIRGKHVLGRFKFRTGQLAYQVPSSVSLPGLLAIEWTVQSANIDDKHSATLSTCTDDYRARRDSSSLETLSRVSAKTVLPVRAPERCQKIGVEIELHFSARGASEGFSADSTVVAQTSVNKKISVVP
jgi:hypothetical protein